MEIEKSQVPCQTVGVSEFQEKKSNLPLGLWLVTYQEIYSIFGMSESLHNRMMGPSVVCSALLIYQLTGHSCSPWL